MDPTVPLNLSICFSSSGEVDDASHYSDRSELTEPCGSDSATLHYALGLRQMYRPVTSIPLRNNDPIEAAPLPRNALAAKPFEEKKRGEDLEDLKRRVVATERDERQHRELVELKLEIARQRERIDILSSELSQSRVEVAALKAENASLIEDLAASNREASESSSVSTGGFIRRLSLRGSLVGKLPDGSGGHGCGGGGSMQMLVDTNSRLMTENERLQVSADGLRKSLQNYIKFSERSRREDQREFEALRRKLEEEPRSPSGPAPPEDQSCQGSTDAGIDDIIDVLELDMRQDGAGPGLKLDAAENASTSTQDSIPKRPDKLNNTQHTGTTASLSPPEKSTVTEPVETSSLGPGGAERTANKPSGPSRRRSDELLVGFGGRRGRSERLRRRWNSVH